MKKTALYLISAGMLALAATSCSDDLDVVIPEPDNITFEDLQLPSRFTHVIPDGGFSTSGLKFNTVKSGSQLAGGFCYSNRSNRSFVWNNDETSMDSVRYSVWTIRPNITGNYLVCHVNNDDAFFTLDKPAVIEYLLVGNTTWNFLAMTYGDTYSGKDGAPVANPNVPSKPMGIWHTFVPGGVKKFGEKDYLTITARGYRNGAQTGAVSFDLACKKGHNAENPAWDYIVNIWRRFDLAALGEVDKVVFDIDSSDKDENGNMRTPAWFCLDGIQLRH